MDDRVKLNRIAVRQGAVVAVDAHVAPGEVLTQMAPSGSCKSTLLTVVIGDLAPDFMAGGRVTLDGRGMKPNAWRNGIPYRYPLLFRHLDVATIRGFGLPRAGSHAGRRSRVEDVLGPIDLTANGARGPAALPRALLLDEAFVRPDAGLGAQMQAMDFGSAREAGVPTLMVTHDEADAGAADGGLPDYPALSPAPPPAPGAGHVPRHVR